MKRYLIVLLLLLAVPLWAAGNVVGTNARITWAANAESDLAGYKVFVGTAPGVYTKTMDVKPADPAKPEAALSRFVLPEGQYYLAVAAYDQAGNLGPKSAEVAFVLDATAPAAPVGVVVK